MVKKVQLLYDKYYLPGSKTSNILYEHSVQVMEKALNVAQTLISLNPDLKFIAEAAMLHDIGICKVNAPNIGCFGKYPYIAHGYLGRKMLENEKLEKHALVCERHVGVGIKIKDIIEHQLPLPHYNMVPTTLEEEIICYADKFFTKSSGLLNQERSLDQVLETLSKYGKSHVDRFKKWIDKFESKKTIKI